MDINTFFLENPKYTILEKNNHFQIRKYDEMTIAKITTVGERYEGLRKGFIPLARYIGAKDREGPKISMTAPVMQQKKLMITGKFHFICLQNLIRINYLSLKITK